MLLRIRLNLLYHARVNDCLLECLLPATYLLLYVAGVYYLYLEKELVLDFANGRTAFAFENIMMISVVLRRVSFKFVLIF